MAEIIRTETRTQTRITRRGSTIGEPITTTEIRTVVRSIHGSDASAVRDFVRALDAAEAPGTAQITLRTQDGLLIGLAAEWTTRFDTPAEETA